MYCRNVDIKIVGEGFHALPKNAIENARIICATNVEELQIVGVGVPDDPCA